MITGKIPDSNFWVEYFLSLFIETQNPIYAWRTYQKARQSGAPIPEEVLRYLDNAAHQIIKMANDRPKAKDRPVEISKALGLAKKGAGRSSMFEDIATLERNQKIALDTYDELKKAKAEAQNAKHIEFIEYIVYEEIGNRYGKSKSQVRKIYRDQYAKWFKAANKIIKSGALELVSDGNNTGISYQFAGTEDDIRAAKIIMSMIRPKPAKKNPYRQ